MKIKQIVLAIVSFLVLSCNAQPSKNIKTIAPKAFAKKINETPKAQILDVRTPEEYKTNHIANAVNNNWNSNNFVSNATKYDKSKPVFVYCKSGVRSAKAAAKLEALGFTTIYELKGGIMNWKAEGLQ